MGGKTETTTSNSAPWSEAQPYLKSGLSDAQKLYSQGIGGQTYSGSTVVPWSYDTTKAMEWDRDVAGQGSNALGANFKRQIAATSDGGLNATQSRALDLLTPTAQGANLNGNPYIEDIISKSARDMGNAINLQASAAGRTGSGANHQVLAREIGDMSSGLRYGNYNDERSRQMGAISDMFGMGQQQKANQAGYTGQLSDAFNAFAAPNQIMYNIGGMHEDLYGRQLQDQIRLFESSQNAPWEQLARMNAIASGAGSLGGSSTSVSKSGGGVGQAAGGLLSLLSLF